MRITTRSGRPITAEVTGLEWLVKAGYEVVVDAELVAGDGSDNDAQVTNAASTGEVRQVLGGS